MLPYAILIFRYSSPLSFEFDLVQLGTFFAAVVISRFSPSSRKGFFATKLSFPSPISNSQTITA